MPAVIGLGGSTHDYSCCVIDSKGKLFAVEDERLTRIRHGVSSPVPCLPRVEYCLGLSGVDAKSIKAVIYNDALDFRAGHPPLALGWQTMNHHEAHAYSTFLTSIFAEAAVLVVDGAASCGGCRR